MSKSGTRKQPFIRYYCHMMNSQILTLHFMPWCRLDRKCTAGPVPLVPFSRDHSPPNFEPDVTRAVNTIVTDFIAVDGRPVNQCVLLSLDDHVFVEGFETCAAFETIYDYVQMACLSSLEGREYLGPAEPYCNSECFALYARQYRDGAAGLWAICASYGRTSLGHTHCSIRGGQPVPWAFRLYVRKIWNLCDLDLILDHVNTGRKLTHLGESRRSKTDPP